MSGATEAIVDSTHARRMDSIYGLQRHVYDLTRKYYLLGRDRLIDELGVPGAGHVLEIGCGTARNLALAARIYPTAQCYGLDISEEMLKTAGRNLARAGVAERCKLARADATDFAAEKLFGREEFDRVFFSYTLSMIPGWDKTLEIGCSLLGPGGELHVVDFGRQEGMPGWFGKGLRGWLTRFHVTPRAGLFPVCEELAEQHGLTCETRSLYRDYARMAVLRRT